MAKQATCHPDKAYYAKGVCYNCYMITFRANNPAYRERIKAQSRAWRLKHPKYDTPRRRDRRALNPAKGHLAAHRKYKLQRYKLTPDDFAYMLAKQGNKCLICTYTFDKQDIRLSPVVDHDHATDKVRGLLCRMCNVGLGAFNENRSALEQAIVYLGKK